MAKVIISNGHFKFILGPAAAEANKRQMLDCFITAGYPTRRVKRWISFFCLERYGAIKRLLNREESIPITLVHPLWISEAIIQVALVVKKITESTKYSDWLDHYGLLLYSWQAARIVGKSSANIYHYRSGYGHKSVETAKRKGMLVLCDHSIAHPNTCEYLVANQGRLPPKGYSGPINRFWANILKDVNQAGHVVVNSDFVKSTFVHQGWDPEHIHVIYTGLDDEFMNAIPKRSYVFDPDKPLKLLFAGELGARKGGEVLLLALQNICDLPWQLEIIGTISPEIKDKFNAFLADQRITRSGFLPRLQLAEHMSKSDIFVFPSLAEGSARVVFMAMACGCSVITTPNSGSIVKNGIHGVLALPGDVDALEESIREMLTADRNEIVNMGMNNAEVIKTEYTQEQYGNRLASLYKHLLSKMDASHEL